MTALVIVGGAGRNQREVQQGLGPLEPRATAAAYATAARNDDSARHRHRRSHRRGVRRG